MNEIEAWCRDIYSNNLAEEFWLGLIDKKAFAVCVYVSFLGYSRFLRIEFGKCFLGCSYQKKFMRQNIFHL